MHLYVAKINDVKWTETPLLIAAILWSCCNHINIINFSFSVCGTDTSADADLRIHMYEYWTWMCHHYSGYFQCLQRRTLAKIS
jgi:hypothetical protein